MLQQAITTSRLLALFPAVARKAPTLKLYVLGPSAKQLPAPVSHNARMASPSAYALAAYALAAYALAANASHACSLLCCASASCMRMGGLPSNGRPAALSFHVLFALCLLMQLERLGHYAL